MSLIHRCRQIWGIYSTRDIKYFLLDFHSNTLEALSRALDALAGCFALTFFIQFVLN